MRNYCDPNLIKHDSLAEYIEVLNDLKKKEVKFQNYFSNSLKDGEREYQRAACNTIVDFAIDDYCSQNFVRNISKGGTFIEGRLPHAVGNKLTMIFTFPTNNKSVKVMGSVVWKSSLGFGVKFNQSRN